MQEATLEFMLFDLFACLTPNERPPEPPPSSEVVSFVHWRREARKIAAAPQQVHDRMNTATVG